MLRGGLAGAQRRTHRDPLLDAAWKHREAEARKLGGLMDWPYINVHWALGYLDRGEPDRCTQLFYSYLSLASGTLDWGEWYSLNKKFTEFDPPLLAAEADSDMPHQTSCCDYILLFRNMMVREVDTDLHIAPAAPRKWLAGGLHYGVKRCPTGFGKLEYRISASDDGKSVRAEISLKGQNRPARMLVHLRTPSSHGAARARVNGKPTPSFLGDCIIVPDPGDTVIVEAETK